MLAVARIVIVYGVDAAIPQLLRELAVPVDVGEALTATVRPRYGLNLHAKVVVSNHGGYQTTKLEEE